MLYKEFFKVGKMAKHVILFGATGSGKSTIANVLYKGGQEYDDVFKAGDNFIGVTEDCVKKTSLNNKLIIYDTIGIGEPENGTVPHHVAINRINEFLNEINGQEFDFICIVKKEDRMNNIDVALLDIIKSIFPEYEKTLRVIITRTQNWVKGRRDELKARYGDIPIIGVDFNNDKVVVEQSTRKLLAMFDE